MQSKNSRQLIAEIRDYMNTTGIKQLQLSYCSNVNQATISKYLKEPPKKVTSALKKICNYAKISLYSNELSQPEKNQVLMKALRDNWDGTDKHAQKISKIIYALES